MISGQKLVQERHFTKRKRRVFTYVKWDDVTIVSEYGGPSWFPVRTCKYSINLLYFLLLINYVEIVIDFSNKTIYQ